MLHCAAFSRTPLFQIMSPYYSDDDNNLCGGNDAEEWKRAMSSCNASTSEDNSGMGLYRFDLMRVTDIVKNGYFLHFCYRQLCEDSIWMATNNRSYNLGRCNIRQINLFETLTLNNKLKQPIKIRLSDEPS